LSILHKHHVMKIEKKKVEGESKQQLFFSFLFLYVYLLSNTRTASKNKHEKENKQNNKKESKFSSKCFLSKGLGKQDSEKSKFLGGFHVFPAD